MPAQVIAVSSSAGHHFNAVLGHMRDGLLVRKAGVMGVVLTSGPVAACGTLSVAPCPPGYRTGLLPAGRPRRGRGGGRALRNGPG